MVCRVPRASPPSLSAFTPRLSPATSGFQGTGQCQKLVALDLLHDQSFFSDFLILCGYFKHQSLTRTGREEQHSSSKRAVEGLRKFREKSTYRYNLSAIPSLALRLVVGVLAVSKLSFAHQVNRCMDQNASDVLDWTCVHLAQSARPLLPITLLVQPVLSGLSLSFFTHTPVLRTDPEQSCEVVYISACHGDGDGRCLQLQSDERVHRDRN